MYNKYGKSSLVFWTNKSIEYQSIVIWVTSISIWKFVNVAHLPVGGLDGALNQASLRPCQPVMHNANKIHCYWKPSPKIRLAATAWALAIHFA